MDEFSFLLGALTIFC